jgi:hypothetical protein
MFEDLLRARGGVLAGLALMGAAAFSGSTARAEGLPPISSEERALTAVAGHPNAPAVILFRKGEMRMMNPASQDVSSELVVSERIKILTEAGKELGDISIAHSGSFRLQGIEGRTVLPDGTVVPLPKEVKFERLASRSRRIYVTKVAFPAVQVGAILDYQYKVRWDSIFFLDPWYFQDRVPVLHSEIAYDVPPTLQATIWRRDPMQVGIKSETGKSGAEAGTGLRGARVRAWADNLPPVPEESHGAPFSDLAAQYMLLPTAFTTSTVSERLLESWPATCKLFDETYRDARRKDGEAPRRARDIAGRVQAAAGGESREWRQARAVYEMVRDEIATEWVNEVMLPRQASVGAVLDRHRGEPAEKALLLQTMLKAIGIDSHLVWAAHREDGAIDPQVPNPAWFDRVLVAAEIDHRRVFLDPSDVALTFGHIDPGYEGTNALLFDPEKPQMITLPETPFSDNVRHAALDLTLDSSGRAKGTGLLVLVGDPALQHSREPGDADDRVAAWSRLLREQFPGFEVAEVKVAASTDQPRTEISWSLSQHAEEALGDQASFTTSPPVGPVRQPFPRGSKRLGPVSFEYGERSEVELTLHWPEGWQPETLPRPVSYQTAAGAVVSAVEVDAAKRTLTYRRRFDNIHRQAAGAEQFGMVQALFEEAQKSDAQPLVLSRR